MPSKKEEPRKTARRTTARRKPPPPPPEPEVVKEPEEEPSEPNVMDVLSSLRPAIQAEVENQPDIIKAGLMAIDGAINTLEDQRQTQFQLYGKRVVPE